jgi:predicted phosphoribosyltransferase
VFPQITDDEVREFLKNAEIKQPEAIAAANP